MKPRQKLTVESIFDKIKQSKKYHDYLYEVYHPEMRAKLVVLLKSAVDLCQNEKSSYLKSFYKNFQTLAKLAEKNQKSCVTLMHSTEWLFGRLEIVKKKTLQKIRQNKLTLMEHYPLARTIKKLMGIKKELSKIVVVGALTQEQTSNSSASQIAIERILDDSQLLIEIRNVIFLHLSTCHSWKTINYLEDLNRHIRDRVKIEKNNHQIMVLKRSLPTYLVDYYNLNESESIADLIHYLNRNYQNFPKELTEKLSVTAIMKYLDHNLDEEGLISDISISSGSDEDLDVEPQVLTDVFLYERMSAQIWALLNKSMDVIDQSRMLELWQYVMGLAATNQEKRVFKLSLTIQTGLKFYSSILQPNAIDKGILNFIEGVNDFLIDEDLSGEGFKRCETFLEHYLHFILTPCLDFATRNFAFLTKSECSSLTIDSKLRSKMRPEEQEIEMTEKELDGQRIAILRRLENKRSDYEELMFKIIREGKSTDNLRLMILRMVGVSYAIQQIYSGDKVDGEILVTQMSRLFGVDVFRNRGYGFFESDLLKIVKGIHIAALDKSASPAPS